ncbi:RcnB family protein [Paucibacter sp. R3-3]|uniref:RcnB family protein n=1 Tax=Roseateles agri TaxID=3098619 RepID=A0ABU5DSZ3_9BURK|nr:RcnB family protein [Paucibacter sp. R3-3]MDY0748905.1 RcnB family protein [Paucibacter sp. R3-3]
MSKTTTKKMIASALAAVLTLGAAGGAFAQRHDRDDHHDHDRDNHEYSHRADMRRGAGPNHDIWVGRRVPTEYRQRSYVVDDWRGHHLRQPPRGYHWVQSGSDYLLVAVATGLIASAILNN